MDQDTRGASGIADRGRQGSSSGVEDIGVAVSGSWRRKVWMIKNVEHFHSELDVEVFGNPSYTIVLED
jgi:hypothetical protein